MEKPARKVAPLPPIKQKPEPPPADRSPQPASKPPKRKLSRDNVKAKRSNDTPTMPRDHVRIVLPRFRTSPSGWKLKQRDRHDLTKKVTEMDNPRRIQASSSPRFEPYYGGSDVQSSHSLSDYHVRAPEPVFRSRDPFLAPGPPRFEAMPEDRQPYYAPHYNNASNVTMAVDANLMSGLGRRNRLVACPPLNYRTAALPSDLRNRDHVAGLLNSTRSIAVSDHAAGYRSSFPTEFATFRSAEPPEDLRWRHDGHSF